MRFTTRERIFIAIMGLIGFWIGWKIYDWAAWVIHDLR